VFYRAVCFPSVFMLYVLRAFVGLIVLYVSYDANCLE